MGRMMLTPPSYPFAPTEELERWVARCEVLRHLFSDDPGAVEDIAGSEDEARAELERRRRRAAGE